jgi:hypothetical protein
MTDGYSGSDLKVVIYISLKILTWSVAIEEWIWFNIKYFHHVAEFVCHSSSLPNKGDLGEGKEG